MIIGALFLFSSCRTVNTTDNDYLNKGVYRVKSMENRPYYADTSPDSINLYASHKSGKKWLVDNPGEGAIHLNDTFMSVKQPEILYQDGVAFDLISNLFMFRPALKNVHSQIHTFFNAAGFSGFKRRHYKVSYRQNPLGVYEREVKLFSYSVGAFAGLTGPEITPTVTNGQVTRNYFGVVFSKGIAGLVSIHRLRFGLSVGFDNLLNEDHKVWIYNNRPWVGFSVGLGLN